MEKNKDTLENDLVSALASGDGPDLIISPQSLIVQNYDKILPITYDLYSSRTFSDTFIEGASQYMARIGILGMPLYADPLIMFWNKDIFSTAGVASFPKKWGEVSNLTDKLTISDRGGNISQAAIALGVYNNLEHAKEILSALFMQAGDGIISFDNPDEAASSNTRVPIKVVFGHSNVESAVRFFIDFSNSAKKSYSWNVSMPNSKAAFSGGSLAMYLGLASDYGSIRRSNPHLNFDVGVLPQRDVEKNRVTYADIYAISVTRGTRNAAAAKEIAIAMATTNFAKLVSSAINLPPARRDLLSIGTSDLVASIFYSSAIMSRSWLDPMPIESSAIFQEMIESILSGVKQPRDAIDASAQKLNNLIQKN